MSFFNPIYNTPQKVSLSGSAFPGPVARQHLVSSSPGATLLVVVVFHPQKKPLQTRLPRCPKQMLAGSGIPAGYRQR